LGPDQAAKNQPHLVDIGAVELDLSGSTQLLWHSFTIGARLTNNLGQKN
jgi:hypothetical protein